MKILLQERHKEKKHKKDKKEKHKKEGKEKRDREEKKEKHREKKERKEKHKDKDKDKHRDKGEKEKNKDKDKKDKDKGKDNNNVSDEKGVGGLPDSYNGGNLGRITQNNLENKDSRVVQELSRRIKNEGGATGSGMVQNVAVTDHGRAGIPGRLVGGNVIQLSAEKEKDKKDVDRKINGSGFPSQMRSFGSTVDNCFPVVDQRRLGATSVPMDKKNIEKQVEEKWKNKVKDSDNKGDKSKDRDGENKRKENNRDKEKEKEKVSVKYAASPEQLRVKDTVKASLLSGTANKSDIPKDGSDVSGGHGTLGKRKELEKNGYINGKVPSVL